MTEGYFCAIGQGYKGRHEIDLKGKYVVPGFMDGHLHLESSVVSPKEYARAVLPHGTVSIFADPHEIANVLGTVGIDYILDSTKNLPLEIYIMMSSCVPATKFDESGACLTFKEISSYLKNERVRGFAELMNYPGVVSADDEVISKIMVTAKEFKRCDGHAPMLKGDALNAYVTAGVESDHECSGADEALEKLRLGQWIMIREGTACKNLKNLMPLISDRYYSRCPFVTDDRHPGDLIREGHIDNIIKKAIAMGAKPELAYTVASYNAASYFHLNFKGAIAPGYQADFVILDDVEEVKIRCVYKKGRLVAQNGVVTDEVSELLDSYQHEIIEKYEDRIYSTINLRDFGVEKLRISDAGAKVIGLVPGEILTTDEGVAKAVDVNHDIIKLAVVERHHNTGHTGVCFVKGYGIREGAIATSIAHDSHNIIAAGVSDEDICFAVNRLKEIKGGMVVVNRGKIICELSLPIAGLMCDSGVYEVNEKMKELKDAAYRLGASRNIDPFMTLSFTSLAVIPKIRLTTLGGVDVEKFCLV